MKRMISLISVVIAVSVIVFAVVVTRDGELVISKGKGIVTLDVGQFEAFLLPDYAAKHVTDWYRSYFVEVEPGIKVHVFEIGSGFPIFLLQKNLKTFDALEWLAAMCSHVPNKGEQMVRYYGYYSNVSRGRRKKSDQDGLVPCILQPEESSKGYRKNWARLIQKIYEVDPLACPRCKGEIRIIACIEKQEVIKKILKHLGSMGGQTRPPPRLAEENSPYSPSPYRLFRLATPFFR